MNLLKQKDLEENQDQFKKSIRLFKKLNFKVYVLDFKENINEMTRDCVVHNIDEIRLIRATNKDANNFYESFKSAKICELPFFIQQLH